MRFNLDGVDVIFPYEYIYPEQLEYMRELLRGLKAKGHCVLEMPSGTGKTIALLSLITSFQYANPSNKRKLVYCTRTVPEMEKVLAELKNLYKYRKSILGDSADLLAIGLSSRKNLCINNNVRKHYSGIVVDAKCRNLTASWVRELASEFPNASEAGIELCPYYEKLEASGNQSILPSGVFSLDDLVKFGKQHGWCPYFLSRRAFEYANIIVYSYAYLLDPKIAQIVSNTLEKECIIVFDEAHNIDNVCIDALSVHIKEQTISESIVNLTSLRQKCETMMQVNANRLQAEYQRLVTGLATEGIGREDVLLQNPVLPKDILYESVPGNIRRAEHFLIFLRKIVEYVRERLKTKKVICEDPTVFLKDLYNKFFIEPKPLRFCTERLLSLFNTLEIKDVHEYKNLRIICDFATLIGTYQEGFTIIIEPYDERTPTIPDPVLQFSCMDASIAIKPVFDKFDSVVITSGTLSPLDIYPKLLNFTPKVSRSFQMSLTRNCLCPLIVTRGDDQVPISTRYKVRNDTSIIRNFGNLLAEFAAVVPDGIICFFTSYQYMEEIVSAWFDMGILNKIIQHKLVFIETPNTAETALALNNYRKACDSGRGAVFLSIARGKVAEGIDFDGHYGRTVIMFGLPFVNTESRILKERLSYINRKFGIKEGDFLNFDALRQTAQCIGRVIRNKTDYGIMVLADKRYNRIDKRSKLPAWIAQHIKDEYLNLSTDEAVSIGQKFLREMSQPWHKHISFGQTLLSEENVKKRLKSDTLEEIQSNANEQKVIQQTEPSVVPSTHESQ